MKTDVETWTVKQLLGAADSIELTPAYQRGPAWTSEKQSLLLDSVFSGYDLPKLYLASKSGGGKPPYEVIDGQQRVRALTEFADDSFSIPPQSVGRAPEEGSVRYSDLDTDELENFEKFELTVSVISEATPIFKRTLFQRLQLGERLNPAELRNALQSSAPREFRSIATSHDFFAVAGIKDSRYRRDDYLTHIFALLEFQGSPWKDIKAPSLRDFVLARKRGLNKEHVKLTDEVLTFLADVARHAQKVFRNKWSFVDAFMFCALRPSVLDEVNVAPLARCLKRIEDLRKEYFKQPEKLLEPQSRAMHKRELYDYIHAYKASGAVRDNINTRSTYLEKAIVL